MLFGFWNVSHCLVLIVFLNKFTYCFSSYSQPISGLLNVYKPYGLNCTYVSNRIKRIIAENHPSRKRSKVRVGHGGTLDQYAEGVLAIGIGEGTKHLTKFLLGEKEYECTGTFGFETDTNDLVGEIIYSARWNHITDEMLESAIMSMKGFHHQESPIYSAKKVDGVPLHQYARKKKKVPTKFSLVNIIDIYRNKKDEFPNFSMFLRCSGGTYVRTIVRDIGRLLNSRATMTSLVRTKKLDFDIKDSLKFDYLNYENIMKNLKPVK